MEAFGGIKGSAFELKEIFLVKIHLTHLVTMRAGKGGRYGKC